MRVLIETLDLIVRKRELISSTEVLMVFIYIEPVESSECADPYMSLHILGKGSYLLIGYIIGDDRSLKKFTMSFVIVCRTACQKAC